MTLVLVGTSHRLAPVEVRERVALRREGSGRGRRSLAADGGGGRLPLDLQPHRALRRRRRATAERGAEQRRRLAVCSSSRALPAARPGRRAPPLPRCRRPRFARPRRGRDPRPGARRAELGAPGPLLERLFREALHAGQQGALADRDRGEPGFGLLGRRCARAAGVRRSDGRRILVIGAGKIGELAARNLVRAVRRSRRSPTAARAQRASSPARFGARAVALDRRRRRSWRRRRRRLLDELAAGFVLEQAGVAGDAARAARAAALPDRHRRAARPRPRIHELDGLLPVRHRRPAGGRGGEPGRPAERGGAGGGDRRGEAERSVPGRPPSTSCRRSRRCARGPRRSARASSQAQARARAGCRSRSAGPWSRSPRRS